MRVLYVTHESFWRHDTGPHHPERPGRLEAADRGIRSAEVEAVTLSPPKVSLDLLARVHDVSYIQSIERFCLSGGGALDADTNASVASWESALRAVGAGPAAVEALETDRADVAFCGVRPPGHHAESNRAMGFCLFNNVGVLAQLLSDRGDRVAIVDWDAHHGNGTQNSLQSDEHVLYVSLHEFPLYPGTGWLDEIGEGPGVGTVINVPLPAETAGDVYRRAFDELIVPVLGGFAPDWLLISAGFDAHASDPLARLRLLPSDYAAMARQLVDVVPPSRVIAFLEGGYDLRAIEQSLTATLHGLAGIDVPEERDRPPSPPRARSILSLVRAAIGPYHKLA